MAGRQPGRLQGVHPAPRGLTMGSAAATPACAGRVAETGNERADTVVDGCEPVLTSSSLPTGRLQLGRGWWVGVGPSAEVWVTEAVCAAASLPVTVGVGRVTQGCVDPSPQW